MEVNQLLTKSDLAKYPFLPEAANYVRQLLLDIEELTKPEYKELLENAEKRIRNCITRNSLEEESNKYEIEIPTFPISIMLVAAIGDPFLKKRYALLEAKKIAQHLQEEKLEKILYIASFFKWKIKTLKNQSFYPKYEFKLHFTNYLENATIFHEKKWKLTNRRMEEGEIFLSRADVARLLEEEIRKHIEKKLETEIPRLPEELNERVEKLRELLKSRKRRMQQEELPKIVLLEAFPPCMKKLYEMVLRGQHLSHIQRFALTTFLVNIGMSPENVMNLFKTSTDFNEKMTKYQVEHIAGTRGSRTKYVPPKCDTLRTHNVCQETDETCQKIHHPLRYYKRKIRNAKKDFKENRA